MKRIGLTPPPPPPSSQGLVEVPQHNIFPISAPCTTAAIPSPPTLTPASALSGITPQQPLPVQAPIFIICTAPQLTKSLAQLNGKPLLQNLNGQILNEASLLQAQQHSGQAFQIVGGNGLSAQTQFVLPQVMTNGGIIMQQKRELHNGHFPTMVNGQTMLQALHPTLVNVNGTTTLLQPNGHTMLSPRSVASEPPSSISPPRFPPKKHAMLAPISIDQHMVTDSKKIPPPLLQVKEEDMGEFCVSNGTSRTDHTSNNIASLAQTSPKMRMVPYSFIPEASHSVSRSMSQNIIMKAPTATHPSLPYVLLNQKDPMLVKPTAAVSSISSSTISPVYKGNSMPIYRFSALNNIQPLQILTTSVPPRESLPEFAH